MNSAGIRLSDGTYIHVSLDPGSKKANITANINGAEVSGSVTLKPAKKESK